jgi:two-component system, cell cycle sensor histidine kinase and response regulator CckA
MRPHAHILIVEDERIIALDLQRRLRRLGYAVVGVATTGADAIACALVLHPDLVLMDIQLPGPLDGMQAAAFLQTHLNLPILYLTGATAPGTLTQACPGTPVLLLHKPVTDETLHAALCQIVQAPPHISLTADAHPLRRLVRGQVQEEGADRVSPAAG